MADLEKNIPKEQKNYSASRDFENDYTAGQEIFKNSKYTYVQETPDYGRVLLNNEQKALFYRKKSFYNEFLQKEIIGAPLYKDFKGDKSGVFKAALKEKVGWRTIKEPDGLVYNVTNNTLYIIEVKYQNGVGTAHEKIGGAEYIRWFYELAAEKIRKDMKVKIVYIVNKYLYDNYRDDFDYLTSKNIDFFVEQYPPVSYFGL